MHRSPVIGGISYRLISREWHSECQRLFVLSQRTQELMLAEIYGGLWIRHKGQIQKPRIFLEMKVMMRDWLQDTTFLNSEEGMLTILVLKLGNYVNHQVIAKLTGDKINPGMYILTQVLPYGMVKEKIHWSAKFQLEETPDDWHNAIATLEVLVHALLFGYGTSDRVKP